MYQFIFFIHVLIAFFLVALVLVQQGKGATVGAAFGAGASQTLFGSRGSGSFLFRMTIGFAVVFFATSIILNNLAMHAYKQERGFGSSDGSTLQIPSAPPVQVPVKTAPQQIPKGAGTEPFVPTEIPTRQ